MARRKIAGIIKESEVKITVGIPTKDRPRSLGKLLACLSAQTYKNWNLIVVNDSRGSILDKAGVEMLDFIGLTHDVYVIDGVRINQTYSHNRVLWHEAANEAILRIDDDVFPQPDFLEKLVQKWTELSERGRYSIGAMGGIMFTEHLLSRNETPPIVIQDHPFTEVMPDGTITPHAQLYEYGEPGVIKAEHLYSSYLYNRDAMRKVGGFPMVYSRDVSYHEETEASHKLHLAGWDLLIVTDALAVHSHELGGTRSLRKSEHAKRVTSDWDMFLRRLPRVRGVNWKPLIGIYSDHWSGIGGGQRLTYSLVAAVQRSGIAKDIVLMGPPHENIESEQFIHENFGIEGNSDALVFTNEPWEARVIFDVIISIGHSPPDLAKIPMRKAHIHYSLFPMDTDEAHAGVDRVVAISNYSAAAVRARYRRNPDVIYPYAEAGRKPDKIVKDNIILLVGRTAGKSTSHLAYSFMRMDIDAKLVVVLPEDEKTDEGVALANLARNRENMELRTGISLDELDSLYWRAKVLWAGRGYLLPEQPAEFNREHFGYTPVEASLRYCVPVGYNAAGYKETCLLRWEDLSELEEITRDLLTNREFWEESAGNAYVSSARFNKDYFDREWLRVVSQTHSLAWDKSIEWRKPGHEVIDESNTEPYATRQGADKALDESHQILVVKNPPRAHVACVCDHPMRKTGYGVIANQIYDRLLANGYALHVFGMNGAWPDLKHKYMSLWPNHPTIDHGPLFKEFMGARNYDAALVMYDPLISSRFISGIHSFGYHVPTVAYVSQEGSPAHAAWDIILNKSDVHITYSQSAASAVRSQFGREIDYAYLGVDHADFQSYDAGDRIALKSMVGWEDKKVIFSLCRNVRNKRIAAMIKAAHILDTSRSGSDHLLLLHTKKVPDREFHGVDVEMYIKTIGVREDLVRIFPTGLDGVPYDTDIDRALRGGKPVSQTAAERWLRDLGMVGRYNMADVYLDLSSAEGFDLPVFEALACGTPVVTIEDRFVREEVLDLIESDVGAPVAMRVPASAVVDEWITGADLLLADPSDAAVYLDDTLSNRGGLSCEERKAALARASVAVKRMLTWDKTASKIMEGLEKCMM